MEGDMKDIVLGRLEQRLKEKDEEIHSLKTGLQASGGEDLTGLREKVDRIETDVKELQITLSEVMKKVGALENAMNSILMSVANGPEDGYPDEDLSMPGSMPLDPQSFDKFAADADPKDTSEDGHKENDGLRFFHLSKNS
jgi:hypothetical protein